MPRHSDTPSPDPRYKQMAEALRASGLEVADDDYELMDAAVKACDLLLDIRSLCRR